MDCYFLLYEYNIGLKKITGYYSKYILDPSVVDVIGFCTKNPHPMLKYLDD